MPWLKRSERKTGKMSRDRLDAEVTIERGKRIGNPLGLPQPKGRVRVFPVTTGRGTEWHASEGSFVGVLRAGCPSIPGTPPRPSKLAHGSALDAGETAYVFLEHEEHRNEELEAAACADEDEVQAWLEWLKHVADPYAVPLEAMRAGKEFGARERFWLEGCGRGGASLGAAFEMRSGFLRRADLRGGALPLDFQIFHLLALRVARGLEDLTVVLNGFAYASFWLPFAKTSFWETAPWPRSLRVLRLSIPGEEGVIALEQRQVATELAPRMRALGIDVVP
jgi:hypothetical protein